MIHKSSEEDNNVHKAKDEVNSCIQLYGKLSMRQQCAEQEKISSLLWERNIKLEESNLMKTKKRKSKSEFKNYFDTPLTVSLHSYCILSGKIVSKTPSEWQMKS